MTDPAALVFRQPPSSTGALVFGELEVLPDFDITINGAFPALDVAVVVAPNVDVTIDGAFPAMTAEVAVDYDLNVQRPIVAGVTTRSQEAQRAQAYVNAPSPGFVRAPAEVRAGHQVAQPLPAQTNLRLPYRLIKSRDQFKPSHSIADPLRMASTQRHQQMLAGQRPQFAVRHQQAVLSRAYVATSSQDRYRDRRPQFVSRSQVAVPLSLLRIGEHQKAASLSMSRTARSQVAIRPPAGISSVVIPPVDQPCYMPDPALLFRHAAAVDGSLIFICDNHGGGGSTVVVPIRRTYVVLNNVSLRRVTGDIELPARSMAISVDVGSWTYGFNATLPREALSLLQPESDGSPALLSAQVNGQTFLVIAEEIGASRTFDPARNITVSGRGKNALLDTPYAPVQQFVAPASRTVQQLMADVLTVNGVPLGWGVDFNLTDWLVPGGAWAMQGSYIGALSDIAGAGGGYLQPHPTSDTLIVLPRYPRPPWEWGDVTADYELPVSVMVQESIKWLNKAAYNSVVVAGTGVGAVRGNITRAGTDGTLPAEMVTHALMTHVDAVTQRGKAVLSDTGRQAQVALSLPVLSETGIIVPGKFVRYVDGSTERLGLVRSSDVRVGRADVWQTITLETHE